MFCARTVCCLLVVWSCGFLGRPLCRAQQTQRVYLSGHDKDDAVEWEFRCTSGANAGKWATLPVPSQWELHGFGTLNYKKDVGDAVNEHGLYRHRFAAQPAWQGSRVLLVFEGVMTDAAVTLNGKSVGPTHQGGYYRFSYEVTDLLRWDTENVLEANVAKHSANESVNKAERTADFWVFGGIYRPVYLKIVPPQFIQRVAIDARADGSFAADVFVDLSEADAAGQELSVEAQVLTLDGTDVGQPFAAPVAPAGSARPPFDLPPTRVAGAIDSPRQWTAETPHLYEVEFRLKQGAQVLHRQRQRFGFRTIEVRRDDGIYVNGRRVVLKGVNRHSTWPDSGRCLSEEVHRLDIETIKSMNMNAVRMSHYPPDAAFLDLCDELGLYVLDELAGWHWAYDTHVGRQLVEEMVTRDVNHPCVLFWDNGNEGGNNVALDEVFTWFDPQQRTVLHPWEAFGGVNTAHYLEYDRALVASRGAPTRHGTGEVYQEWEDLSDPNKYIYMPTEMMHGLYDGGGGAGLADYWSMMRESPVLGGGFLWVLFDEGIRRPDGTLDCAGNQAPDGLVGPYREREGSFYAVKELWSPIQVKWLGGRRLDIQNDYSFTDATECRLTWQFRKFRTPRDDAAGFTVVSEGAQKLPSIPPGESGELRFGVPLLDAEADALAVRIDDPDGRELWTWVLPLHELAPTQFTQGTGDEPVSVDEHEGAIVVAAGDMAIEIDKSNGMLRRATRGDQEFSLANGPLAVPGASALQGVTHQGTPDRATVELQFTGMLKSVTWNVNHTGWVECQYEYVAEGPHEFFGVTFDYPRELVRGKCWLGDGPFRVWKNRRAGVTLNVWQNEANDTITGYSGWEYPEFADCFANVHWLELQTDEGPITVVPHNPAGFVQVLTPSQPPEQWRGQTDLSLPQCGLALLDAIPPIGSKFKPAATTGPAGQLTEGPGARRGAVSFYFGELPE
ncbi:MAG: glycoside hydrolase family 2 [Planctomycetaceae bacterium]|nr:glycoside hydrolase family 2 [Planctomycetaceae bacterium]